MATTNESLGRVFVTRSLAGLGLPDPLERLRRSATCDVWAPERAPEPAELIHGARSCRGVLCLLTDRIDSAFLVACSGLQVVSSLSVGVDHIDLDAAAARGIRVGNTPGVLTETTADLAFGLMLGAARRIPEADRFVRAGSWTLARRWEPDLMLGRDLYGRTLGIVGLGPIGRAVARRAAGFGMRVLGFTRSQRQVDGVEATPLPDLLAEADFVSVHVALTPETHHLLGQDEIDAMKPGAVLVNTARGGIVDERAVARALSRGHLAAAALDVFEDEPLGRDSPLLEAPNLVLVPHIGSASIETRRRMADLAVENLLAGLEGRPLPHSVLP